jgi:undecaprenyl-diphosphatase
VIALDRDILLALRERGDLTDPIGPDWLRRAALDITSLGSHMVLLLVIASAAVFLVIRSRRAAALVLVASGLGAMLLSWSLKLWFARARPDVVEHLVGVYSSSFPSGHALLSAAIYLTLGAVLTHEFPGVAQRRYFMTLATVLTLLIGLSRVYLGVHWPSDVLGGWCIGTLWAWGCSRLVKRLQ